jgi:PAS domain S-box-containing protein
VLVTAAVALAVTAVAVGVTHQMTLRVRRDALLQRASIKAAVVQTIARQSGDPGTALEVLRSAHEQASDSSRTGEVTIGRLIGDTVLFVLHRASDATPGPIFTVDSASSLGEPMQAALDGQSGWMIGRDYEGTRVLAAYQPLPDLGWGIVAKMDMTEVQEPFWWALGLIVPVAMLLTVAGVGLFLRLSEPLILELEASEERFRSMIQNANDLITVLAPDGTIRYESPAVERVLGHRPGQLEGTQVLDLVHPEDVAMVEQAVAELSAQRTEALRVEVRFRHADGSYRCLEVVGSNLLDSEAVGGIVANSRDVTEQRRIQQELAERVKELDCLLNVSGILTDRELTLPQLARKVATVLPQGWQYPEIAVARLEVEGESESFATPGFTETPWCQSAEIPGVNGPLGRIELCYTEERPEAVEGPFLAEERDLLEAVAQRVGDAIEHLWAEEALAESEERFRTLFTQVPVGLYRTTPDGRFLDANPALAETLGRPDVASLMATPLAEVYADPADRERWRTQLAEKGEARGFEVQIRRWDGTTGWVRHSGRAITDDDGEVIAYEGAAEDITARKAAEEALGRSEAFLSQSQRVGKLGGWEYDMASGQVTWTEETYRIHGVTPETYDPSEPEQDIQFYAPGDRDVIAELFGRAVAEGEPYDVELQLEPATGGRIWVHVVGEAELESGRVVRVYGTIADVTERHRAHEALERSNAELQQFAYVASHDLQEPLRMVVSYLQLLDRRLGDTLDERARRFMEFAVDGGQRMQQLIHDLLAFSRVQTHGEELEAVELEGVMRNAMRNLEAVVAETGGEVHWDELPTVHGDRSQVVQLMQNLVGNGLKFHGDEPPRIEVRATDDVDGWQISVADNGIGIPPEHAERIFEVFQRLHGRGAYPGTGIGLAICKRIVERHGGRIWVESTPDAGATFHLILPKAREA